MIRVLLHGAGRMAGRVAEQLKGQADFELTAVVARTKPEIDFGANWYASLQDSAVSADLLIDFSLPGGPRLAADWCGGNGVPILSGTTGLTDTDIQALKQAGLKVPVLWASNLSAGVALVSALVRQAAAVLGASANIRITDIHHQHKADAPSGTALSLAAAVMEGRAESLQDLLDPQRLENLAHDPDGELVFSSIREGEVVGEHTIRFELPDEVIEIRHKALDRDVFASGALRAGKWLVAQQPGYYSTSDWLDLK